MQRRVWSIWLVMELAFILLVLLAWPVQASPIWECESQAGWTMSPNGDVSELPVTSETSIIEFQPPNKMKPIKTGNAFEQKIYEEMVWEQVGSKFYGNAVVEYADKTFTVSEVLGDESSTITLIFKDGDIKTALGRNKCVKSDPTSATAGSSTLNSQTQAAAAQKPLKQEEKSFWCKADELLKLGVDAISEEDMVTGVRTVNVRDQEAAAKLGSQRLDRVLQRARNENVRIFGPGDPSFERVRSISERLIAASHYKNSPNIRYEVIDYEDVNAFASGGGNYFVLQGLLNATNDAELAFIIGHEIAHSSAGHIEEAESFVSAKDVVGDKPQNNYSTALTNVAEQEADKIAVVYTALAGYDPCASIGFWDRQQTSIYDYAFVRTHPANPRRSAAIRNWCSVAKQYWVPGRVNPNTDKILKCNALFCNVSREEMKACSGGGVFAALEVLAEGYIKNQKIKKEQKRQEAQVAEAQKVIARQQMETPPNVNWSQGWNAYKGSIVRHGVKAGLSFAIANGQGQFYYNHNGEVHQGALRLTGQNEHGYWFNWQDAFGNGSLVLQEYTDGSLRGQLFMNDGTNPGKPLGSWEGYR